MSTHSPTGNDAKNAVVSALTAKAQQLKKVARQQSAQDACKPSNGVEGRR